MHWWAARGHERADHGVVTRHGAERCFAMFGALRVIELKTGKLAPADSGEINFYVAAVDGELACATTPPPSGCCCAPAATSARSSLSGPAARLSMPLG
jgi:hypothetical protein